MYQLKQRELWASDVAGYLNRELSGEDLALESPYAIRTPVLLKQGGIPDGFDKLLLITDGSVVEEGFAAVIRSASPELDLARVLLEFFASMPAHTVHPTAVVSEHAMIGRNVGIGAHSVIGDGVEIGDNTRIENNVVIHGPARIGESCVIKDGAVIGSEGYGFVADEDGKLFHAPQLGLIRIGDRVWIGANSTVERAMIKETTIEDDAKIDDLVHIGNGSTIGPRSRLTAGTVISFDVWLGADVQVAPSATVRHSVTVADGIVIGQGAVVVTDLPEPGGVYVGVPARLLRKA
jgi:UDP-3-O-[3-hydroxymyristoyl] glucosamine N-acyltransferase